MRKTAFLLIFLLSTFCSMLVAQTLEETIQSLSGDAAKSYVSPMVSAFGSNMNGGWFHQAPKAKFMDWDFEISAILMGSLFNSNDDTFSVEGNFRFTRDQAQTLTSDLQSQMPTEQYEALLTTITDQYFPVNIYGPTIIGKTYDNMDEANTAIHIGFPETTVHYTVQGQNQDTTINAMPIILQIGGLLEDLPALPFVAPQVTIGTLAGTKMSVRYLPTTVMTKELGSIKYFGIGFQHNPAIWLPIPIPVDIAVSFFTQTLKVGDLAKASATNVGLNVSKTFGPRLLNITPYAGISYESSNMEFKYTYVLDNSITSAPVTSAIKFDVDGGNSSRLTAGLNFRAAIFNLNFDYNVAKYPSFTTGIGMNFSW